MALLAIANHTEPKGATAGEKEMKAKKKPVRLTYE